MTRLFLILLVGLTACASPPNNDPVDEVRPLNGTDLYVRAVGAGDPIIVVHGGPVLEHGYLLPFLEPLADSYRLIFYDQRLSGRSAADVDTNHVHMADFVEDLDAVRASFGYDRVHLLAHSFGGRIAMEYAIDHPDRLRSLMLLSPIPASSNLWLEEESRLAAMTSADQQRELAEALASEAFVTGDPAGYEQVMRAAYRPQFSNPALADQLVFYRPPDIELRSERFGRIAPDLMRFDLFKSLAAVRVPTLIVYGSIEPAVGLSGTRLAETMPNARLVTIPEAGHFTFVEQPEAFMTEVRGFLGGR